MRAHTKLVTVWAIVGSAIVCGQMRSSKIGHEVAVPRHLQDGEEYDLPLPKLVEFGRKLFTAAWTVQEGAGRPLTKGTGDKLSDPTAPLVFPRAFNRISGPDANSCAGCHNKPLIGGGGDIVGNVFVLGQRFDAVTFDATDRIPTRGSVDEQGHPVTLQSVANSRATLGMFGSGYIEMLARQMTADLQSIRDSTAPSTSRPLISKGVSFGSIARDAAGAWDVSRVEGLSPLSLTTTGKNDPPTLILRPFHQAGRVVSLREFTNNAYNHHHGIQSTERFGKDTDPDGDGVTNELTRADVTASVVFQATMAVPVRVIANDPEIREAVLIGEQRFSSIGCASCHVPRLPLDKKGWIYTEPNPYNPAGNLRLNEAPTLSVDLSSDDLPQPRLKHDKNGIVWVPAFTDLKLHDICSGPDDPNVEPLDMQQKAGSTAFLAGNRRFLTRKLWDIGNVPPYFHHGQFTTMREAVLAHGGEALVAKQAFQGLSHYEQDSVIEFLKSLQVGPETAQHSSETILQH